MFGLDFFGYYFISSIIMFKVRHVLDFFGYVYFISSIIIFKVRYVFVTLMLVGVWLGLLWVLFYFFDHYIQSSVQDFFGCCFIFSIITFKVQFRVYFLR